MQRRIILTSVMMVAVFLIVGLGGAAAEMTPAELSKASEARAVSTSDETLTADLIMKKVDEAVTLLGKKGAAAFPEFQGQDTPFIFAGTYIWIHDQYGVMRMHPIKYKLNGRNLMNMADSAGKLFFAVMNEVAEEQADGGWVDYMWPKPGEKKPSSKISFVKQVKFGDDTFIAGCGTYDMAIIGKIKNQ